MTGPALYTVMREKLQKLRQLVAAPQALARDDEALHDLRVGLKEWSAAMRLAQGLDPEFPNEQISEQFRPVFSTAGRLRFWQLQRQFLSLSAAKVPVFATYYRAQIRNRRRSARKQFLAASSPADWPTQRQLGRDFRHAEAACTEQRLQAYFDELQDRILSRKTVLHRRRAGELHELRKSLREYSDNRKLAAKRLYFDPGPPRGMGTDVPALQSLLGDWHDQVAACRQLAEDLRDPRSGPEALKQGRTLLRSWRKTERDSWNRVMTQLDLTPG